MYILSNFISIYCFISFIIGAVLASLAIVAINKDNESRNKVRFFVQKNNNILALYLYNTKIKAYYKIANGGFLKKFGLNPKDFADMKEGEIREVFINLED